MEHKSTDTIGLSVGTSHLLADLKNCVLEAEKSKCVGFYVPFISVANLTCTESSESRNPFRQPISPNQASTADLGNQITGSENVGNAPDPAMDSLAKELSNLVPNLAKLARARRTHVMEHFGTFFSGLSDAKTTLSLPDTEIDIPFPWMGVGIPSRFKISGQNPVRYHFIGREVFAEFLGAVQNLMGDVHHTDLWLYGPMGYGKSHLLATTVCLLTKQGYWAISIPDCYSLLRDPVRGLRDAMLFAWADDPNNSKEISEIQTKDDVKRFLAGHERESSMVFVLDHFDAFDEEETSHQGKRTGIAEFLNACRYTFRGIICANTNNTANSIKRQQDPNQLSLKLHGGLTKV